MPLENLFKSQHKMRGAEALKMSNDQSEKGAGGVRVPPWVWAIIASLAVQIIGAAYVTGRVTGQLDAVSYRVQRIEAQMDRYFESEKR